MTDDDRLAMLDALWAIWREHGEGLTAAQWALPTRLGSWTVRELYAHAGRWPVALGGLPDRVRDAEPSHPTAAALLAEFNRPDGIARRYRNLVADGAREDAARHGTEQLVEQFAVVGPRAVAAARRLGPVVVDYSGLALLRLDEAVSIGVMEATVHLLDLCHALDLPPDVPAAALAHTAVVLAAMAPPVDFIEAATGRRAVEMFPLLV